MPDYQLTPCLYRRAYGDLREVDGKYGVRIDAQTLSSAQKAKAVDQVTPVKDIGTRLCNCARPVRRISKRYAFNSCLRTISLGYKPKVSTAQVGADVKTVPGLELALTVGKA